MLLCHIWVRDSNEEMGPGVEFMTLHGRNSTIFPEHHSQNRNFLWEQVTNCPSWQGPYLPTCYIRPDFLLELFAWLWKSWTFVSPDKEPLSESLFWVCRVINNILQIVFYLKKDSSAQNRWNRVFKDFRQSQFQFWMQKFPRGSETLVELASKHD